MNYKEYQNEIIIFVSFVLMILTYSYKSNQVSSQLKQANQIKHSIIELKEVIALKKLWANKKTSLKIKKFKQVIDPSKTKWSNKRKKLSVSYSQLSANELNKVTRKLLNIPMQMTKLEIHKIDKNYKVELKCKW